jgi:hypothetical protein
MDSLLIPSSMQRIRAFLIEMCGMKVKPWAGAEETLSALHATLVARQSCDIFWASLRGLLETLARDLKARQDAEPGALLDNEVLSDERYASLLDEIRACLATQASEAQPGSAFRQLAQRLSAPALGLLLLLGGVTTVGCDRSSLHGTDTRPDAAATDVRSEPPDAAPDAVPDTAPADMRFVLPDIAPPKSDVKDAVSKGPEGGTVTLPEIMDSCDIPEQTQANVLACLSALHGSWTTGIAAALAGQDCGAVSSSLEPCSYSSQCNTALPAEFDPSYLRICEPILIYLGVRFV